MDITEYLKRIKEASISTNDSYLVYGEIYSELHAQKEELEKKEHLIQVLKIVGRMKELRNMNFYENLHSGVIIIYRNEGRDYMKISFYRTENSKEPYTETRLADMLEEFQFNAENIDKSFYFNRQIKFSTKPGFEDELLNSLLSKELKNILDYNELQLSTSQNNNSTRKKTKI